MTALQIIFTSYAIVGFISIIVGVLAATEFNSHENSKMDVDTAIPFSILISIVPGINLFFLITNLVVLFLAFYTNKRTTYFDEEH